MRPLYTLITLFFVFLLIAGVAFSGSRANEPQAVTPEPPLIAVSPAPLPSAVSAPLAPDLPPLRPEMGPILPELGPGALAPPASAPPASAPPASDPVPVLVPTTQQPLPPLVARENVQNEKEIRDGAAE